MTDTVSTDRRRAYDALVACATAGEPAPTIDQLAANLHVSREKLRLLLAELTDMKLIVDAPVRGKRRQFYLPAYGLRTGASLPASARRQRECITGCGRRFKSDGPHHRMCNACRSGAAEHQFTTAQSPADAIGAAR